MTAPSLNLIVIRVADLARSERFYSQLGLRFDQERHGTGPVHKAAAMENLVFEIYPLTSKTGSSAGCRLGFQVDSVETAFTRCLQAGGKAIVAPKQGAGGLEAIIADPDGHRVHLCELAAAV